MGDPSPLGRWVRQRRKLLGLSQDELAERLCCAYETVRKIEAGSRRPSRALAELLGRALAVPEAELPAFIEFARNPRAGPTTGANSAALFATPHVPSPPPNLPVPRTSFVGRRQELVQLRERLLRRATRLLTLTGPPGIGKTRLGLALAQAVHDEFPDGVHFVPLGAVDHPAGLVPAIGRALAFKPAAGQLGLDELKSYLAGKELLLLLDNFEQIASAAGMVGELVDAASGLTVLVTSRCSLGLYGEQRYAVPPLALPAGGPIAPDLLRQYEAVQLFVERAEAVRPGFFLRDEDVPVVVEIARQLDGLPLAIELAAARARLLGPDEIRARLSDKLRLLAGGPADLPRRQQTLRGAIAWSYDLLSRAEQALFERLAVFVGGATREAIAVVAALPAADLDDGLISLLDKSLLRLVERPGRPPRFRMLWTIREFAAERLAASGDEAAVRARHAAHNLAVTAAAAPHLTGPGRAPYLQALEEEHDNLRVALNWYLAAPERAARGLRLAGLLDWHWIFRGYLAEGREWLGRALRAATDAPLAAPAADLGRALSASGWLGVLLNDCQGARPELEAAVAALRPAGDSLDLALALARHGNGLVYCDGDAAGRAMLEEAVALLRSQRPDPTARWLEAFVLDMLAGIEQLLGRPELGRAHLIDSLSAYEALGDEWGIGQGRAELGRIALMERDYATAQRYLEEAIVMDRRAGHPWAIATTLRNLGDAVFCQNDLVCAATCYAESLALFLELGDRLRQGAVLRSLGHIARAGGHHELACHYYRRALLLAQQVGSEDAIGRCLAALAGLACAEGVPERGAILFGAAAGVASRTGRPMPPADEVEQERYLPRVAALLGEKRLAVGLAAGQALSRETAISFALSSLPDPAQIIAGSSWPAGGREAGDRRGIVVNRK